MLVLRQKFIHRVDLKANPNVLFIFGDNLQREGFGGQAAEMRGEPNSFGIATKRTPGYDKDDFFYDGQSDVIPLLTTEFEDLLEELKAVPWNAIVIPLDGIGTGLSRMPEFSPQALVYIEKRFKELENL
jgi:hypothetical protein